MLSDVLEYIRIRGAVYWTAASAVARAGGVSVCAAEVVVAAQGAVWALALQDRFTSV